MIPASHVDLSTLHSALASRREGVTVKVWEEIDSTNNIAKAEANTDTPTLYIARTQTGGRGRLGRSFHSPADTGLYMTVAYTSRHPLSEAVRVTAAAAVAAASAIEALTGISPAVKWVNDLYLNGAKVGGILTEAVTRPDGAHRMVVGLGINLTTTAFPEGLRAPAASLFSPSDAEAVTPALVGALAGEITRRLLDMTTPHGDADFPGGMWGDACLCDYRRRLLYVNTPVICTQGSRSFEGVLLGVDDGYSLLVETKEGVVTLSSGEISVRPAER